MAGTNSHRRFTFQLLLSSVLSCGFHLKHMQLGCLYFSDKVPSIVWTKHEAHMQYFAHSIQEKGCRVKWLKKKDKNINKKVTSFDDISFHNLLYQLGPSKMSTLSFSQHHKYPSFPNICEQNL